MSKERVAEELVVKRIEESVPNPQGVLAISTGRVVWLPWQEFIEALDSQDAEMTVQRLLDVRAYDEIGEFRAVRCAMGEDFVCRYIKDADYAQDEILKDTQLLDIDVTQSSGRSYVAMGGGTYTLPIEGATKVTVHNYIAYDAENGMARFVDFRIAGLER